jgi:hypothetical protein
VAIGHQTRHEARKHARTDVLREKELLRMDFDFDDWQDAPYTPAVDRYIARPSIDLPEPEREEPREYKRGTPFTEQELAAFKRNGGAIDYCGERLAKRVVLDRRAAERKDVRPFAGHLPYTRDLIDTVEDAIAYSTELIEKMQAEHRVTAAAILDKPCNARSKKLSGLPPRRWRHQQAIRIARALAFDGITQAEYCRKHKISRSQSSRMLAGLYEREPGLAEAISGISDCAAMLSWQKLQQTEILHRKEREERKLFGISYGANDVVHNVEPFPSQASAGRMAREGGGFNSLTLIDDEPEDESEDKWYAGMFICALFDPPPQGFAVYASSPYRYLPLLSRHIRTNHINKKTGKPQFETWRHERAVPIAAWLYEQHHDDNAMSWPPAD